MALIKVMVNIPFKVAGGRYYSETGKVESMSQNEIDRALKVNPNMVTVLPKEDTELEEDADAEETTEPKKPTKKKKEE